METIKTYDHVNREDHSMSFGISRMEDIYEKRKGQKDQPHRHDFYTVIIVKQGKGEHNIDFNSYKLQNQQVYFIHPGQVHQLIEDKQSFGYSITFSNQFLAYNNISLDFIENLNLFHDFGNTPPITPNTEELSAIEKYAEELIEIYKSDITFQYEALGALLKLLLIKCNNLCDLDANKQYDAGNGNVLLRGFKKLLNQKYTEWHGVAEYANALNVTGDHLNRVIKSLTGKTTKEHIQSRIIVTAKRYIYFSNFTNKELSYELGFSEPANFSAFFKKCTGISPSEFRNKEKAEKNN